MKPRAIRIELICTSVFFGAAGWLLPILTEPSGSFTVRGGLARAVFLAIVGGLIAVRNRFMPSPLASPTASEHYTNRFPSSGPPKR